MKMLFAFLFFVTLSRVASAQTTSTIAETFYSTTYWDQTNSTLIWNPYYHMLHAPLAITYTSNINNHDSSASVGNGQDGIFDVGTYANFSVGGVTPGNVITIDTSVHPVLQVLYFNLALGWSIRGVGPNPLWIESFGPVTISGLVDCSGSPGANTDAITTSPTIGGVGHCGGANGGNGGYATGAATVGATAGGTITGGGIGLAGNPAGGGGGGGAFRNPGFDTPTAGQGGGLAGVAGVNETDDKFTVFGLGQGGGSGGGGGGYNSTTLARGASGGGGGGVIRITAIGGITVTAGGKLFTFGGAGGGGTLLGGGGGGGGSGGIWLQTTGNIIDNGAIDAGYYNTGAGPDPNNAGVVIGGNNGGRGSDGRTWLTLNVTHATPPFETPFTLLPDEGEAYFSVQSAYTAQSLSYDSLNTAPNYNFFQMISTLPGNATASLLIAGSNDNFVNDNSGFVPAASLQTIQGKRFFKFQVTLQQDSSSAPASTASNVSQVTASYINYQEKNFNMTQSCGVIAGGPPEVLFLLGLFGLIYFLTSGRLRRKIQFPIPRLMR